MTDDIVTRLRKIVADPKPVFSQEVLSDAADEIEQLRKDKRELDMEIFGESEIKESEYE